MKIFCLTSLITLGVAGGVYADFSGYYDTPPSGDAVLQTSYVNTGNNIGGSQWSLSGSGVTGSGGSGGILSGPYDLLVIQGNRAAAGQTLFTIPIQQGTTTPAIFNWSANSMDLLDEVGYYIKNGANPAVYTTLAISANGFGIATVPVSYGDIFGFYVNASSPTAPGHSLPVGFAINNFIAPVPEVSTILANGLMLSAIGGFVIYRKRQTSKNAS